MNQKNMLFIIGMAVPIIIMIIVLSYFNNLSKPTEEDKPKNTVLLFEMPQYKDKKIDNITKIEINKYTEGGLITNTVEDKDEIDRIMYSLLNMKLGEETQVACEDNTTIYVITTPDETIKVEIECDWVIIGSKRYLIEK